MAIKYKLLALVLFVTIASLSALSFFTFKTFTADKKLFVMDLNQTLLHGLTSDIKLELKTKLEELQLFLPRVLQASQSRPAAAPEFPIPPLAPRPQVASAPPREEPTPAELFHGLPPRFADELLGVTFYRAVAPRAERENEGKGYEPFASFHNKALFAKHRLPESISDDISAKHPLRLAPPEQGIKLYNRSLKLSGSPTGLAVLTMVLNGNLLSDSDRDVLIVADFTADFLIRKLQQSELAEVFLIFKDGKLLVHPTHSATVDFAALPFPHPILGRLARGHFPRESMELEIDNEPYFVNITETGFKDLYAVAQTRKSEAFMAITDLSEKGGLVAACILSLSIILTILFASRLTKGLKKIKDAVELIGTGQLGIRVEVQSRDEIGWVAFHVQKMAGKLKELMERSVAEAHDEDEGQTARVVEATLLTPPKLESAAFDLAFHSAPSVADGGSFWDATVKGPVLTLLIGDATAEGVGAAIATAMARACFKTVYGAGPEAAPPEQFLWTLNRLLYDVSHAKLSMTACVASINLDTGETIVATAGHHGPLRRQGSSANETAKAEALEASGDILGAKREVSFRSTRYQLDLQDTLLFYTAGVAAAANAEGNAFGTEAIASTLAESRARSAAGTMSDIEAALKAHLGEASPSEDVTFVLVQWRKKLTPPKAAPAPDPQVTLWKKDVAARPLPAEIRTAAEEKESGSSLSTKPLPGLHPPRVHETPTLEQEMLAREGYLFENKKIIDEELPVDDEPTLIRKVA